MASRRGYGQPLRGYAHRRRHTLGADSETFEEALADLLAQQAASLSPDAARVALTVPQARRTGMLRPGAVALVRWCGSETDPLVLARLHARDDLDADCRRTLADRYPGAALALAYDGDPWALRRLAMLSKWSLRHAYDTTNRPVPPGPISRLLASKLAVGDLDAVAPAACDDPETAFIVARRLRGVNPSMNETRATAMLVAVATLARYPWPEPVTRALVRWLDWFFVVQPDGTLLPRRAPAGEPSSRVVWPAASTDDWENYDRALRFAAIARAVLTGAVPLSESIDVGFSGMFAPLCGLYRRAIVTTLASGEHTRASAWAQAAHTRGYGFVSGEHGLLGASDLGPYVTSLPEDLAAALMAVAAPDAIELLLAGRPCGPDDDAYARALLCHPASAPQHLAAVPTALRHRLLGDSDVGRRFAGCADLPIDDVLACPAHAVLHHSTHPDLAEQVLTLLDFRTDALAVLASYRADTALSLRAACATALATVRERT